jgi:beta-aspartyl-dipeptidase (metallo-type)
MPPLSLLTGATLMLPSGLSRGDLLLGGGKVLAIGRGLRDVGPRGLVEIHDLSDLTVAPGLIDGHVHFLGGGGGDGYSSRAPELQLTDFTANGITTAVGAPGIDMVSRSFEGLIAKARGLHEQGMTGYAYVGGFHEALGNVTGSVWRDCYLITTVAGVKIAVGEPRAPSLSVRQVIDLARNLAWVERATGRSAVLHIHLGLDPTGPELLHEALPALPDPARVVITHCNFSSANLDAAIALASTGVGLDVSTSLAPSRGVEGAVEPANAVMSLLDAGVESRQVTISTDGNGHIPAMVDGRWEKYDTQMSSLMDTLRELAQTLAFETALEIATANPARALRFLPAKGALAEGADADLIALDKDLRLVALYAAGTRLVHDGRPVVQGRFDNRASH